MIILSLKNPHDSFYFQKKVRNYIRIEADRWSNVVSDESKIATVNNDEDKSSKEHEVGLKRGCFLRNTR